MTATPNLNRRRPFVRTAARGISAVFLTALAAMGGWLRSEPAPDSATRPNFLIIMADQQSPHVLGCAGDRAVRTPHLDQLAARGVRFAATSCASPLCVPSRMTFLTSRQCSDIQVWTNACVLDSATPTFPGLLAAAGYETVLAGRMHFNGPDQRHGFTRRTIGDVSQPRPRAEGKHPLLGAIPGETTGQSRAAVETAGPGRTAYQAYDEAVTDSACRFLADWDRQPAPRPLALVVGFVLPHCPYICPPELFRSYRDRVSLPGLPPDHAARLHPADRADRLRRGFDELDEAQARKALAAYCGLVEYHDRLCGRILAALGRTRLAGNTVVVYTSDHGEMAGEHGLWTKSVLYEGSVGVPMIWSWPGRFPAGVTVSRVTSLLDVGPTLLDLAGAGAMPQAAGRSLRGFLAGPGNSGGWPDEAFAECCGSPAGSPSRMLRQGPWKIVVHHGFDQPQLFHLGEDPGEWNDRRDDPGCAAIREQLLRRVREGWDGERVAQAIAQVTERRKAVLERARAHATPEPDFWLLPGDANQFPME